MWRKEEELRLEIFPFCWRILGSNPPRVSLSFSISMLLLNSISLVYEVTKDVVEKEEELRLEIFPLLLEDIRFRNGAGAANFINRLISVRTSPGKKYFSYS
jgi:hypothetical protein